MMNLTGKALRNSQKNENSYLLETSAKTGENVESAFLDLTQRMIKGNNLI